MATIVELPNGTEAEFPDGMDHAAISTAIQSHLAKQSTVAPEILAKMQMAGGQPTPLVSGVTPAITAAVSAEPKEDQVAAGMKTAIRESTLRAQNANEEHFANTSVLPNVPGQSFGAQFANEIINQITPKNIAITAGLGPVSEAAPILGRLVAGGFGALALHQGYENWKDGKTGAALADVAMGGLGALHAAAPDVLPRLYQKMDAVTPEQREQAFSDIQDFLTARKAQDAGLPQTAEELAKPNPVHENQASQPEAPRPEPDERSPGNREAGAEVQPAKAALTPALRAGSQIIPALPGESHVDIANRINSELPNPSPQRDQINEAVADDSRHVFVDQTGNVLDRDQGGKFADENGLRSPDAAGQPLHSEHLNAQAQALPEAAKEGTAPGTPGATPEQLPGSAGREGGTDGGKDEAPSVSIRNARVDEERAKRGELPLMQPARQAMGSTWDAAMKRIEDNPNHNEGQRTVDDILGGKKKEISEVDHAVLLHEKISVMNERDAQAEIAGDQNASEDQRIEARTRWAAAEDRLNDIDHATQQAGTITGRALQFRKALAGQDYTFEGMERRARASRGRGLTPEESEKIGAQAGEIDRLTKAADEREAAHQQEQGNKALDTSIGDMLKESKPDNPRVASLAERLVRGLESEADKARARIRERFKNTNAGVDPTVLYDVAVIGASHIARGSLEFGRWSSEFLKEFSGDIADKLRPHLQEIFDASNRHLDERVAGTIPEKERTAVKARATKQEGAGEREQLVSKIESKTKDGTLKDAQPLIQKLALNFVRSGITEREPLLDAVHEVVSRLVPDATRSETRDAISGYGDYRQLDQETAKVQLRQLKGEMQQIGKIEDMQSGEAPKRTGVERRTPSDQERALIREVNKLKDAGGFNITDPATQLKSRLQAYKTRTANRITDLQERLDTGDFAKRVRPELKMDQEAMDLRAQVERVKENFQRGLVAERLKNRTPTEKVLDTFTRWRRGFLLSNPVTLAKLTAAAAIRMGSTPLEEGVGAVLSKVPGISQVAERAPREGGASVAAEARALTQGVVKGMQDAGKVLSTGKGNLDALYGKKDALPRYAIDFLGSIHGALKSVPKRAEFERSLQKRIEFNMRNGVDVTDPMVQTKMMAEAYKDANRAIFMQDNRVVSAYKAALARLEQPDKTTGKTPLGSKVIAAGIKTLLPIVKVPTNIVGEVAQYAFGSVTGSARLANAFRNGIENLQPEQADLIMRELKKGSIGGAAILYGYLHSDQFGGYYQRGEKRNDQDVKAKGIRIGGVDIPPTLSHAPVVEAFQIGATARRVADAKVKGDKNGLATGSMAALAGMVSEVPFVQSLSEPLNALTNPRDRAYYFGELAKSIAVPGIAQFIAQQTDRDKNGNLVPRKGTTITERIEEGIPGLRESVPEKSPSKTSSRQRLQSRRIKR